MWAASQLIDGRGTLPGRNPVTTAASDLHAAVKDEARVPRATGGSSCRRTGLCEADASPAAREGFAQAVVFKERECPHMPLRAHYERNSIRLNVLKFGT
jgi:hypothetical protein